MSYSWETLWTFETENLCVSWSVAHDDDLDLSWDDTGEVQERLERGLYIAFVARIRVTHKETGAVLGEAYLGGNVYENASDFRRDVYFYDMIADACGEARKVLQRLQSMPLREAA